MECVDLKDVTIHQHSVMQAWTRTLGMGCTLSFLQGVVVVVPVDWQFVGRKYWTTLLKTRAEHSSFNGQAHIIYILC